MKKMKWVFCAILLAAMLSGCAFLFNKKTAEVTLFWDASLLQNVTRLTEDGALKSTPRVSPDGTKLLYVEYQKSGLPDIVLLRDIRVPAKTPLATSSGAPAWYNDNNKYVYVSVENGKGRILRSAITGGGKTYVTRTPVSLTDDCPTVRGEAILFQTQTSQPNDENDGGWQIASMKDNGTEITFLGQGHSPSWHPTEPKFLFIRKDNIYEMDMASMQVTEILNDPDYRCALPGYSGDGQHIVFQKGAEVKKTGTMVEKIGGFFSKKTKVTSTTSKWQIFAMRSDGTNLSALTLGEVNSYHPSWDINGYVYFVSDASGKTEVYRAQVNLD